MEAAYHLSRLQRKCGRCCWLKLHCASISRLYIAVFARTKYITAGSRVFQSAVEVGALVYQSAMRNDVFLRAP